MTLESTIFTCSSCKADHLYIYNFTNEYNCIYFYLNPNTNENELLCNVCYHYLFKTYPFDMYIKYRADVKQIKQLQQKYLQQIT